MPFRSKRIIIPFLLLFSLQSFCQDKTLAFGYYSHSFKDNSPVDYSAYSASSKSSSTLLNADSFKVNGLSPSFRLQGVWLNYVVPLQKDSASTKHAVGLGLSNFFSETPLFKLNHSTQDSANYDLAAKIQGFTISPSYQYSLLSKKRLSLSFQAAVPLGIQTTSILTQSQQLGGGQTEPFGSEGHRYFTHKGFNIGATVNARFEWKITEFLGITGKYGIGIGSIRFDKSTYTGLQRNWSIGISTHL